MSKFILSAGHNPSARGAVWEDVNEYDTAIKWIPKVSAHLVQAGHTVVVVKTGTLSSKIKEINENASDAKLVVELHFNAAGTKYVEGNETLYCPNSKTGKLAADAYNAKFMESALAIVKKDRGVKEGWYRMEPPSVNPDAVPDALLVKTKPLALIIEPAFICQVNTFSDSDVETLCKAIADGLMAIK